MKGNSSYSLLNGVRVLEIAQLASCSVGQHLADLGAEVVKIENADAPDPTRDAGPHGVGTDGQTFFDLRWNRGKRSVALNVRTSEGRKDFLRLVREADVVIEGGRAGLLDRLDLGHDVLRAERPDVVLCSVTGMGTDGPYSGLANFGLFFDAHAGLEKVDADHPSPPGVVGGSDAPHIAMYALGAYGALGIVSAVLQARARGVGAHVEVSCVDIAAAWEPGGLDLALNAERATVRPGNWTLDGRAAHWALLDPYRTSDDEIVMLLAHKQKFWVNFCNAVDRPDLLEIDVETVDAEHDARSQRLWTELRHLFAMRTQREWTDLFLRCDIAGGPIYSRTGFANDRHFLARENTYECVLRDGSTVTLTCSPVRVRGERFSPAAPPEVGEYNELLLGE